MRPHRPGRLPTGRNVPGIVDVASAADRLRAPADRSGPGRWPSLGRERARRGRMPLGRSRSRFEPVRSGRGRPGRAGRMDGVRVDGPGARLPASARPAGDGPAVRRRTGRPAFSWPPARGPRRCSVHCAWSIGAWSTGGRSTDARSADDHRRRHPPRAGWHRRRRRRETARHSATRNWATGQARAARTGPYRRPCRWSRPRGRAGPAQRRRDPGPTLRPAFWHRVCFVLRERGTGRIARARVTRAQPGVRDCSAGPRRRTRRAPRRREGRRRHGKRHQDQGRHGPIVETSDITVRLIGARGAEFRVIKAEVVAACVVTVGVVTVSVVTVSVVTVSVVTVSAVAVSAVAAEVGTVGLVGDPVVARGEESVAASTIPVERAAVLRRAIPRRAIPRLGAIPVRAVLDAVFPHTALSCAAFPRIAFSCAAFSCAALHRRDLDGRHGLGEGCPAHWGRPRPSPASASPRSAQPSVAWARRATTATGRTRRTALRCRTTRARRGPRPCRSPARRGRRSRCATARPRRGRRLPAGRTRRPGRRGPGRRPG